MADEKELDAKEADEILLEARARFKLANEAERENRKHALDDLKFIAGEQWPEAARKARGDRPCLTINRMPSFVRQVVNEQRKIRPAIDVIPADSRASKATADVLQGLIRHIERNSRSQVAYDNAFEYAVSCGIGHFRVTTRYCDDEGLDQEISIERIENPFTVYRDPMAKEPDHSDDRFTFITDFVDPDDFEEKYGFRPSKLTEVGQGDDVPDWFDGDDVRVAEYWRVETEDVTINVTRGGQKIEGKLDDEQMAQLAALGDPIVGSRTIQRRSVEQYILTYDRVISVGEWRGKYIPVLTVIGGELNVGGKRILTSLVRDAKEPARIYNYWASAETEIVALQPKAPWIAPEGSFIGHENEWARANTENVAYLEYVAQPGGAPQRQFFPGVPQGIREGRMAAAEDIKAVTGMYDASLGARSNETSGVAIRARAAEGDTATFHYIDNMSRAIEQCGRVIIDLAPSVYDAPRAIRIVGPENQEQLVAINQLFIDPATGQEQMYDLSVGKYDVAVKVGPSFESKRQEMTEAMLELSGRAPQLLQMAGDLIIRNMDWPESEKIADRLQKMLPPQLQERAPNEPPPPPQPDPAVLAAQEQAKGLMQAEQIKAQAAEKKAMIDLQAAQQKAQMEIGLEKYKIDKEAETELQKQLLANQAKLLIESQHATVEEARVVIEQQKAAMAQQEQGFKNVVDQLVGSKLDMTPIAQMAQRVIAELDAPREGEIVRGPDGRAIGVRSVRRKQPSIS